MIFIRSVALKKKKQKILEDINLTVKHGDFVYITGESGAGKTSLLKLIYMEVFPSEGEVLVGSYTSRKIKRRHISLMRREMGIIFQDFRLLSDRNVYDNLQFVLQVTDTDPDEIPMRIANTLNEVELLNKQYEMPSMLSGGEQQRVAIARAIVSNPKIVLADEPTANLDQKNTDEVIAMLHSLSKKNIATIVVTHDHDLIFRYPATTYLLENKTLVEVEVQTLES